jgi:hypothetical protein
MSFLMPKTPKPQPLPAVPSRSAQEIQDAAASQRNKFYGAQGGRAMTDLSGGSTGSPMSAVVRLLGEAGRI